jgi:RNA polymerase sigma-70 factor (ECF subfamily)
MRPPITDDQFSALIEEHKGIIYKIANSYRRHAEDQNESLLRGIPSCAKRNE